MAIIKPHQSNNSCPIKQLEDTYSHYAVVVWEGLCGIDWSHVGC